MANSGASCRDDIRTPGASRVLDGARRVPQTHVRERARSLFRGQRRRDGQGARRGGDLLDRFGAQDDHAQGR
jgi:hypothetical protein